MIKRTTLAMLVWIILFSVHALIKPDNNAMMAHSNQEIYAYRYLVELYDSGDITNLTREIMSFTSNYPNSTFMPYVRFLEANLALDTKDYVKAHKLYSELIKENLNQEVMAILMLNYATSLIEVKEYSQAMHLLQRVDSEFGDVSLSAEANVIRADIYYKQGQFYSAERAYQKAITDFPEDRELKFRLFSTYVKLKMDAEAVATIWNNDPDSPDYSRYLITWLQYLLTEERYQDFDSFLINNDTGRASTSPLLLELRIRRALLGNDFLEVAELLKQTGRPNPSFDYYYALLCISRGEYGEADRVLQDLAKNANPEVAVASYLERLKILFHAEPLSAISQLIEYLKSNKSELMLGELYYTLGYFCYKKTDYPESIKQLSMAKQFTMNRELGSRIDILIGEAWFALGKQRFALDSFNRYLNLYPEGLSRDKALFHTGYIYFVEKDYGNSKFAFENLLTNHPDSYFTTDAHYYLAEMDFFLANYNMAMQNYLAIKRKAPDNQAVNLRIAQIYYYQGDYALADSSLIGLVPSYEGSILKGSIGLATKAYSIALDQFVIAESFTTERLRKAEAQSYQALCLFQMKRYKEASEKFLLLSNEKESPDTYLYLSAKSANAARDYHQALQLYDSFIDQYPSSKHFLSALSDVANAYYNMGNYKIAVQNWMNILTRFRNITEFTSGDMAVIRDAILGIELGMKRTDDEELIDDLLIIPETFMSRFISFELNYIILKLYADSQEWAQLIVSAEEIRSKYPQSNAEDIEMMIVTGLINLNQFEEADSLLSTIYGRNGSLDALLKWAELEFISQHYDSALEKYQQAFQVHPSADIWSWMLECSEAEGFKDFDLYWNSGLKYVNELPTAKIIRMKQLFTTARYTDALKVAEDVLSFSLSTHDHAMAFLITGLVDYQKQEYASSIATFRRILMLFPDFPVIRKQAAFYIVKALFLSGAKTEAEMQLTKYTQDLEPEELGELESLLLEGKE